MIFVHEGKGVLEGLIGNVPYDPGNYVVIPVGTTHRLRMNSDPSRFPEIESTGEITTPRRDRNEMGQSMEHSPFCKRDISVMMRKVFEVRIEARKQCHSYICDSIRLM